MRTYHEFEYGAETWPQTFRVIVKAESTAQGDNPRYVVTSLEAPVPKFVYRDLYCARGQDENFIKMLKNDLASNRTSDLVPVLSGVGSASDFCIQLVRQ